jgi:hypothetical protein
LCLSDVENNFSGNCEKLQFQSIYSLRLGKVKIVGRCQKNEKK